MLFVEIVVVAFLILVNGFLAMSEIALVSSRPARLHTLVEQGVVGARRASQLVSDPARFLSTVQIGITLVGILSGAFSGATLGMRLAGWLDASGVPAPVAETVGIGVVVVVITYCALIVGELVPKQFALQNPEAIAARVAPVMIFLSRLGAPLVWLLSVSGKAVLRAIGRQIERPRVSDEEIEALIAEAESAGLIDPDERRMIASVMRLGDREVRSIMSPRSDVDWVDLAAEQPAIFRSLRKTQHSHLPAADGDPDRMIGMIRTRELMSAMLGDKAVEPQQLIQTAPVIGDRASALEALTVMRESSVPFALVEDETGRFQGVLTPVDILDAIAGVIRMEWEDEPKAVRREDGSWLFAGSIPVTDMAAKLGVSLPSETEGQTLATFMQSRFGRLPATGEAVEVSGWRFEIVDLDGRRIDKVLATAVAADRPVA